MPVHKSAMSHYRRARKVGGTCFFTVVSFRCQEILCDEWIRNALREGIKKHNNGIHSTLMHVDR
ncbi:MAG: hypothetical protein L3J98_12510 [Gammaproteobacteria bacterium]|nr:hypothetical protein [Gammaproteobacteria bacterium]MCF6260958.1 hypothetical protein [Gammaproteobacteria bacterium]